MKSARKKTHCKLKTAQRRKPRRGRTKMKTITRAEARRRAERHVFIRMFKGAKVADAAKVRWCVYDVSGKLTGRELWLVYPNPHPDTPGQLKSSTIIAVCKRTGKVLYEGSAGEEG